MSSSTPSTQQQLLPTHPDHPSLKLKFLQPKQISIQEILQIHKNLPNMPYLAVIIPQVPAEHKDTFTAAFPKIAAEMKEQPQVLGVSGGQIVGMDGAAVTDFKFLQTLAFMTAEDAEAFKNSAWATEHKAKYDAKAAGPALHALFHVADFPKDASPKAFTQFSRITVTSDEQAEKVREAWTKLMTILGKETWGGVSVGGDEKVGMGLVGWDSLEEAKAAFEKPEVTEAFKAYHVLGECKDVMVKLQMY